MSIIIDGYKATKLGYQIVLMILEQKKGKDFKYCKDQKLNLY